jgi:hypothetical protein
MKTIIKIGFLLILCLCFYGNSYADSKFDDFKKLLKPENLTEEKIIQAKNLFNELLETTSGPAMILHTIETTVFEIAEKTIAEVHENYKKNGDQTIADAKKTPSGKLLLKLYESFTKEFNDLIDIVHEEAFPATGGFMVYWVNIHVTLKAMTQ